MQKIIDLRHQFGLSQTGLANKAKVSLATIQNLEAGKGNPSLSTLKRILKSLGSQIDIYNVPTNIEMLNKLGLPLMVSKKSHGEISLENLIYELKIAFKNYHESDHRMKTVLEASYFALQSHYPDILKKHFSKMPILKKISKTRITGQHIKLRRIIINNFARYIK